MLIDFPLSFVIVRFCFFMIFSLFLPGFRRARLRGPSPLDMGVEYHSSLRMSSPLIIFRNYFLSGFYWVFYFFAASGYYLDLKPADCPAHAGA